MGELKLKLIKDGIIILFNLASIYALTFCFNSIGINTFFSTLFSLLTVDVMAGKKQWNV